MNNSRRDFFKSAAAWSVLGAAGLPLADAEAGPEPVSGAADRRYWVSIAERLARPVLENLARRELRKKMPVEELAGAERGAVTHLEAFGRLLYGLAPWLAVQNLDGEELRLQRELSGLARSALEAATDPASPDDLNFSKGGQPLVDTAFLAGGILRAPGVLWEPLKPAVKERLIAALKSSRTIPTPDHNNWVLFAATVEAALLEFGEPTREDRLENCIRKMLGWYCGDGVYGDGDFFHFDGYNSFVIHPMLLEALGILKRHDQAFSGAHAIVLRRAQRYAEIQERFIAPDGTFPSVGRSTTYRLGAFQTLALMAWHQALPERVKPAQVRCALTAVSRRLMEAPGTFDAQGWLRIGFCGHQPALGERYISTGSLYLCSAGLLPLGLPPTAEFWSAPAAPWTAQKLWAGENMPADHALTDVRTVAVPTLPRGQ